MPHEKPPADATPQSHAIPNPQGLLPRGGLTTKHKRLMFYGAMGIILLIVLANIVATNPSFSSKRNGRPTNPAEQQNPTPAQIRDWETNLKQAEAQLQQETQQQQRQLNALGAPNGTQAPTADDLQRAAALQDAAQARTQYEQMYGPSGTAGSQAATQRSQLQAEKEQQAYKSLFADNVVRQETPATGAQPQPGGAGTGTRRYTHRR